MCLGNKLAAEYPFESFLVKRGYVVYNFFHMTHILTANIGSYPRIGEDKDQQRHRRGLANFENKEISAHAFRDVEQSVIQEIIQEQVVSGLDEVTDGLVSWADPISHFTKNTSGITFEGYHRYFDSNFYYQKPVFSSKPHTKGTILAKEFEYAQKISAKPVRVVLTGPFTLACHTGGTIAPYNNLASRMQFFGDLLLEEIHTLVKQGAKTIQMDEPSLAQYPDQIPVAKKVLEKLFHAISPARAVLALYFSPVAPLIPQVLSWPIQMLQLDFTMDGKNVLEKLLSLPTQMMIGFGLLNARTIHLEGSDAMKSVLKSYIDKWNPATLYVTPSAGLEFLPQNIAISKLQVLSNVRDEMNL